MSMRNNRSRRRIAAVTFLSNISLDGSYKDTRLALLPRIGAINKGPFFYDDGILEEPELDNKEQKEILNENDLNSNENKNISNESTEQEIVHSTPKNTERAIQRETHFTQSERKPKLKKRLPHQTSLHSEPDRFPYNSSNESLGPSSLTLKKTSPIPPSIPEQTTRQIKIFKPNEHTKFGRERIVMVTSKHLPFMVCSFIPYEKSSRTDLLRHTEKRKRTVSSGTRPLSSTTEVPHPFDLLGIERAPEGQEVSYEYLLNTSYQKLSGSDESVDKNRKAQPTRNVVSIQPEYQWFFAFQPGTSHSPPESKTDSSGSLAYHPYLLDDPELIAGKHRTVLTFASYMTSVINYVKPSDLKKEINDKFKVKFPHIQLTLTKLRSLKREMKKIATHECSVDLLTVAQSYVYFEKLILKGLINKQNRKLCAGACLILSAKLNDVKGDTLKLLIEKTESTFRVCRKDLVASEFAVLVALEFALHLPTHEVLSHYQRLSYDS